MSAVFLAIISAFALLQGGFTLIFFVSALSAAIGWELGKILGNRMALVIAALTFLAVAIGSVVPWEIRAPAIIGSTLISMGIVCNNKILFGISHVTVQLGALSFLLLAQSGGIMWLVWLVAVVVLTDISGYFAGRIFGGPKFWPAISPKKTWSGTTAGWFTSAVLGFAMMAPLGAGAELILFSIVLSFSSQIGDIFQSFVKRRSGVKDSSNLIPGHGGVWDRFDGMLAAALIFWPLSLVF